MRPFQQQGIELPKSNYPQSSLSNNLNAAPPVRPTRSGVLGASEGSLERLQTLNGCLAEVLGSIRPSACPPPTTCNEASPYFLEDILAETERVITRLESQVEQLMSLIGVRP